MFAERSAMQKGDLGGKKERKMRKQDNKSPKEESNIPKQESRHKLPASTYRQ